MPEGEALGLAVSGGGDSLGLLRLMLDRGRNPVRVATVDHRLRAGSAEEAADVAALCARAGVPHATLVPDQPIGDRNIQAAARRARYRALARWADAAGLRRVATGHQCDDQAETLVLRLLRGSGLHGLSGVRETQRLDWPDAPSLLLVRPCLGLRRSELDRAARAAGWPVTDDPANRDDRHDRARLRKWLPEPAAPALARSARALAEAGEALAWAEERAAERALRREAGRVTIAPAGLPPALARSLLLRGVAALCPGAPPPTGPEGDRLLARLVDGGVATLRGLRFAGGPTWTITRAPPARQRDCKAAAAPYLADTHRPPDPAA